MNMNHQAIVTELLPSGMYGAYMASSDGPMFGRGKTRHEAIEDLKGRASLEEAIEDYRAPASPFLTLREVFGCTLVSTPLVLVLLFSVIFI